MTRSGRAVRTFVRLDFMRSVLAGLYDFKIKSYQLHLISHLRLDNNAIFFTVSLITHTIGGGFANSCNLYLDSRKIQPSKPIDVLT